jgi:hypothetical protein
MDSLTNLVKECLKNGMGFMIESFEYSKDNKKANLYQNSFRYYQDIDKVNFVVKSYFTNYSKDDMKSIDESLKIVMLLLEEHCLTFQKLEEFFNSAPANKRKNQQLDLIYDESGLNRNILEKAMQFIEENTPTPTHTHTQSNPKNVENQTFEVEKNKFLNSIERMVTNIRIMKIEFQNSLNNNYNDSSGSDDEYN